MLTLLIGHRGAGKSTMIRRLEAIYIGSEARRDEEALFLDLDNEIEATQRRTIESIFKEGGEAQFRKLEEQTFRKIVSGLKTQQQAFMALGAGFEFDLPASARVVWIRRATDFAGRIFLNRPKLSDREPLTEWRERFAVRDPRYRKLAHEELTVPECGLHDRIFEEFFFKPGSRTLPMDLTLLPENFQGGPFFDYRRQWGLRFIEIRDDLLTRSQIDEVEQIWPSEKRLYAIRKSGAVTRSPTWQTVDWAVELGPAPFAVEISSCHERQATLAATLKSLAPQQNGIAKLAVEIHTFRELLDGHEWWKTAPSQRVFLPRSTTGRWQWYRQLFGPKMPLHFFREGQGSALDQPCLWQALIAPKEWTSFAAVLGSPVVASWTPSFQREFFDPYGIPTVAIDVSEAEWNEALPILAKLGLKFAAVTSPLKKVAHGMAAHLTDEAKRFGAVNTLAFAQGKGWYGHNTDYYGAQIHFRDEFPHRQIPVLVWGGGGTKEMLKAVLPQAEFVSARSELELKEPVYLVWAVGRNREFRFPKNAVYIQGVVDLNYTMDSPGREIALKAGSPYKSGEAMFIQQGYKSQEFWKGFIS